MAVTVERLIATLEARFDKYDRALNKALDTTDRTFKRIETRGKAMEARMASIGAGVGRRFAAALAAGLSVRAFQQFSDAATRIDNALKVAGLSGEELERVYGRLRDSAVKNAAPLESLVELYGRAALVQKELGISGEELLNFTDKIAVALRVSGKSASESSGALLQLSQALGSGVVRAEEFNSILEGALPIAQAAARGLKEAGGSVAALRQLVVDGKVSSEAFFRAFEAGAPTLEEKVASATFTVSQATGNLNTALIDAVREFNNATGASAAFAGGINNVAVAIADVDVAGFVQKIKDARNVMERFFDDLANAGLVERFAEAVTGLELEVGKPIDLNTVAAEQKIATMEREIELLQQQIENSAELGFDTNEAHARLAVLRGELAAFKVEASAVSRTGSGFVGSPELPGSQPKRPAHAAIKPVSLSDYDAPDSKKKKGSKRENDFARETRQVQERTAALMAETAAMAGLNPLIEDYGYALEKARATHELLTAAKKAGIEVTPALEKKVEALADAYAKATVEAAKLAEEQDRAREAAEAWEESVEHMFKEAGDALVSVIDGSEKAADAVKKLAIQFALAAAQAALLGSGPLAGIVPSIFGLKDGTAPLRLANGTPPHHGPGRVSGPGGPRGDKVPAWLSDKEFVVRADMAQKHRGLLDAINANQIPTYANGTPPLALAPRMPSLAGMRSGGRGPSSATFNMSVSISGTGDKELEARLQKATEIQMNEALRVYDREVLPVRVNQVANDPYARG